MAERVGVNRPTAQHVLTWIELCDRRYSDCMTYRSNRILLAERPTGLPGPQTWELSSIELPEISDGEFVVRINYVSLDPAMRGWLNDARSYVPPVKIGEVMRALTTGTVVESQHPDFAEGTTVSGIFGVTEYAISDGTGVNKIDTTVAAEPTWLGALGMPGMTAYFGLNEVGAFKPSDTVVVSAAAGAVGSVVGQLAKAQGARVIGIAGGPDKCAWVTEIGFDEVVDYKNDNVTAKLRELAPDGIDLYFDNVGGEILDAALANLRRGARIVICGAISQYNESKLPPGPSRYLSLLVFRARMEGFVVFDFADRYGVAVKDIAELISSGKLQARETIVRTGIAGFGDALLGLFEGANTGKLVLAVGKAAE